MTCKDFCNWHCSTMDCPHVRWSYIMNATPYDPTDVGEERIDCEECQYRDDYCTCNDCYFEGTEECPNI